MFNIICIMQQQNRIDFFSKIWRKNSLSTKCFEMKVSSLFNVTSNFPHSRIHREAQTKVSSNPPERKERRPACSREVGFHQSIRDTTALRHSLHDLTSQRSKNVILVTRFCKFAGFNFSSVLKSQTELSDSRDVCVFL